MYAASKATGIPKAACPITVWKLDASFTVNNPMTVTATERTPTASELKVYRLA